MFIKLNSTDFKNMQSVLLNTDMVKVVRVYNKEIKSLITRIVPIVVDMKERDEIYTKNYRYKLIKEKNKWFLLIKPYLKEDLNIDLGHTMMPLESTDWEYIKEFIK